MMSIGQSLAQRVHLMQRSSSSRNMPRKRCEGSQRSSGYCTVTFFFIMFLAVIPKPAKRSSSMILSRKRLTAVMTEPQVTSGAMDQELDQPGDEDVGEGQGDQPLPAQVHQLIEPVAREGAAEPDVGEEEDDDFQEEPDDSRDDREERQEVREGGEPAAQEEGRGDRRDDDHVGVLAQ